MKFIIPIFIIFICFACNSSSKSNASTQDSVSTNSETNTEVEAEINNEPIKIGTDSILFRGFGTEPFWGVEVRKSGVVFSISGMDSTLFTYTEPVSASSRPVEYFRTYFLKDKNGKTAQLVAKKGEECACSDGMSENDYAYHVSFLYDNAMWEGCGESVTSK